MLMFHELEHLPGTIIFNSGPNVSYWHKADMPFTMIDVRFWG
jgi:hypothetical protein